MKNLLVYINPTKNFDDEGRTAIKIQIDNSLDLGWDKKEIIIITNFAHSYKGIKSVIIDDENFSTFCPTVSKINAILYSIDNKLIKDDEICWFHDLDAYELYKIKESELGMGNFDLLLPDWGRIPRWVTGSIFFKNSAYDIFKNVREICYKYRVNEEVALQLISGQNALISLASISKINSFDLKEYPDLKKIEHRIEKVNISYNFHSFNVRSNYKAALKPIRIAHFHFVERPINPLNGRPNQIDFFLKGINKINLQIVPPRLVAIFKKHGVK